MLLRTLYYGYAGSFAKFSKRPAFAAPPGTDALVDDPAGVMHVNRSFRWIGTFFKDFLGLELDPTGRGYLGHPADLDVRLAAVAKRAAPAAP